MHDPSTQTTVWWWPEGTGAGAGWRWAKGNKNGDIFNGVNNKNKFLKKTFIEIPERNPNCLFFLDLNHLSKQEIKAKGNYKLLYRLSHIFPKHITSGALTASGHFLNLCLIMSKPLSLPSH